MARTIKSSAWKCALIIAVALLVTSCASTQRHGTVRSPAVGEMILIPAGDFIMGKDGDRDDNPAHTVRLDAFQMDRCEVTNRQYLRFCEATDRKLPMFWGMEEFHCGPEFPEHPVVGVSMDEESYAPTVPAGTGGVVEEALTRKQRELTQSNM